MRLFDGWSLYWDLHARYMLRCSTLWPTVAQASVRASLSVIEKKITADMTGLGVTSTTDSDSVMLVFLYGDGDKVHSDESSADKASASTSGAWTVLSRTSGVNTVAATASATPVERKTGQHRQLLENYSTRPNYSI